MPHLSASQIRELARRHDLYPAKALGQNFVVDANTVRRVVRLAGVGSGDRVIEVGAGLGALTVGLAEVGAEVVAVEKDRHLIPALNEVTEGLANVQVVTADALDLDLEELTGGRAHKLVSNLPYNVATPLVAKILEEAPSIEELFFMVQREVGERLVAGPGSKAYGAVSVLVAYHCDARLVGKVPASVFWPPPKVESALVRLIRRPCDVGVEWPSMKRIVRAAFAQRRKTVRNSLASALEIPVAQVTEALESAVVDPDARAESLSLQEFAAISKQL